MSSLPHSGVLEDSPPAPAHSTSNGPSRLLTSVTGIPAYASGRLLHGVSWNALGSVIGQAASFASAVVVARILGKQVFGQFALVQTTVAAFSTLAGLGLGTTATKYVSECRNRDPKRAGEILGLSAVVAYAAAAAFSAAVFFAAPWLIVSKGGAPDLTTAMRLSAVFMFFITMNGFQMGALSGLEAFRRIAGINVAYGLATLIFTSIMAYRFGLHGAVLAQGLSAALLWAAYHFALKKEVRASQIVVSYRNLWRQRSALFQFSVPTTAAAMIASLATWWCNATLAGTAGYAELALFSATNTLRLMVLFMPVIVSRVTAPVLNNMYAARDAAGYRRTFWGTVALTTTIAVLTSSFLIVAGRWILHLFGKEFTGSLPLILLLLAATILEVLAASLYQAMFSGATLWGQVAIISVWTTILIGTLHLTVARWGASALALSYLAAWTSSVVLYALVAVRRQQFLSRLPKSLALRVSAPLR